MTVWVLVTGAQSGIGAAIATAFAREGATVVINWLDDEAAAQLVAETARPARSLLVQADIGIGEQVEVLFDTVARALGRIVTGSFRCMRAAARMMVPAGRGAAIINPEGRCAPSRGRFRSDKWPRRWTLPTPCASWRPMPRGTSPDRRCWSTAASTWPERNQRWPVRVCSVDDFFAVGVGQGNAAYGNWLTVLGGLIATQTSCGPT